MSLNAVKIDPKILDILAQKLLETGKKDFKNGKNFILRSIFILFKRAVEILQPFKTILEHCKI